MTGRLALLAIAGALAACNSSGSSSAGPQYAAVGLEPYKPALPGDCYVILVHGFNVEDEKQFDSLSEELYRRGANVFSFHYEADPIGSDNNNDVVDKLVSAVKTLKDLHGLDEIKIVGHSLGGLVCWRASIEDREQGKATFDDLGIDVKFVSLATAWGGFGPAAFNGIDPFSTAPIGSMLAPDSVWLTAPGKLGDRVSFLPIQTVETDQKQFGDGNDDIVRLGDQRNDAITGQAADGTRRVVRGHTGSFRATGDDEDDPRSVPPETLALILDHFGMTAMTPDDRLDAQIMGLGLDLCTEQGFPGLPDGPLAVFVPDEPAEDAADRARQVREQERLLKSLKGRGYTVFLYVDDYKQSAQEAGADLARGVKGLLALTGKDSALLFLDGRGQEVGRWATSSHPQTPSADTLAQGGGPSIRTVDFGETTEEAEEFDGTTGSNVTRESIDRSNFENSLDQGQFLKIESYVQVPCAIRIDGVEVIPAFGTVRLSRLGGVQAAGPNANSAYEHLERIPGAGLTLDGRPVTSDCPGLDLGRTYGRVVLKKEAVREIGMNLTGDAGAFLAALDRGVDDEPSVHSSTAVAPKDAEHETRTYDHGALRRSFTQGQVDGAFNNSFYPCGQSANGLTLCGGGDPVPAGDFVLVFNVLDDPVPLSDPVWSYQYAFVFDSDGVLGNNYQPAPAFPNDFFKDSDLWFQATYTPAQGWKMRVTDAAADPGGSIVSAARILVVDNVIALVVPAGELAVAAPSYRVTSFRHKGDFGLNPPHDWNGDIEPPVSQGLGNLD